MLSVELKHLADVLDSVGILRNVSQQAKEWSARIHHAIWETTVVNNIFAYETNGKLLSSKESTHSFSSGQVLVADT